MSAIQNEKNSELNVPARKPTLGYIAVSRKVMDRAHFHTLRMSFARAALSTSSALATPDASNASEVCILRVPSRGMYVLTHGKAVPSGCVSERTTVISKEENSALNVPTSPGSSEVTARTLKSASKGFATASHKGSAINVPRIGPNMTPVRDARFQERHSTTGKTAAFVNTP